MQVISDIGRIKGQLRNSVLAIGIFDGVHLGHRYLLKRALRRAKLLHRPSVVMTFFPHPAHVLRPKNNLPLLVSLKHRLDILGSLGVDFCLVIPFTKQFSSISPRHFINRYLKKNIRPREIFVGHDFRFGKNRAGDGEFLKKHCRDFQCKVSVIPARCSGRHVISSTVIRRLIAEGNLESASRLLGRFVSVRGNVVHGDRRGKNLGFPTANLNPIDVVLPPVGIYIVRVSVGGKIYRGVANLGRNPTFKKSKKINIEAHLFDFNRNIYGNEIEVQFVKKIRNEKKFSSISSLIHQIEMDETKARLFFHKFKSRFK